MSDELAFAEKLVKQWADGAGYEIVVSKDGGIFTADRIAGFDAFIFYTTGDLTQPASKPTSDNTPVMPAAEGGGTWMRSRGGRGLLDCIPRRIPFGDAGHKNDPPKIVAKEMKLDPYCARLVAEFTSHGSQQKATIRVASKTFPGLTDLKEFETTEEWYAFTNFSPELHVILVQDTTTMKVDAGEARKAV